MRTQRYSEDIEKTAEDITANLKKFVQDSVLIDDELVVINDARLPGGETLTLSELQKSIGLTESSSQFTLIEIEIVKKFTQGLRKAAVEYRELRDDVKRLNQEVVYKPSAKDTAQEKKGNVSVIIPGKDKVGIDSRISKINANIEGINNLLAVLPTNRVQEADVTFRTIGSDQGARNITADVFTSEFSELIGFEIPFFQEELAKAEREKQRRLSQFEIATKQIQHFTGEITGLSIFDVLCVFLALFTIDLKDLISLLNIDARTRLINSPFYSFNVPSIGSSLETSKENALFTFSEESTVERAILEGIEQSPRIGISNLEQKVKEFFRLSEAFFTEANNGGQNRRA
jgi:hypothetical protein